MNPTTYELELLGRMRRKELLKVKKTGKQRAMAVRPSRLRLSAGVECTRLPRQLPCVR